MTARRDLMALRCHGCAYRRGSYAWHSVETQADAAHVGARFGCHQATDGGRCAGAVARHGTDEAVRAMLQRPPRLLDAFAAITERGVCGHEHATVSAAVECAIASGDPFAGVGRLLGVSPGAWIRLDPAEQVGAPLPCTPYYVVAWDGGECPHAHWTGSAALRCWMDLGMLSATVRFHRHWPVGSGPEATGEEVDEDALWAELGEGVPL